VMKTWRKLHAKGIELTPPIIGLDRGNPLATSAVMKIFTGSDIVTMGVASTPSAVLARKPRRSAWRCAVRETMGGIAFMGGRRRYHVMAAALKAKSLRTRKTVALARGLLGKILARRQADGSVTRHRITEVEAYDGECDRACHASKGRTRRTEVMYQPGGVWYVYLCYGTHEMLNLVTGPANYPAAVLIRGVEGITGPGRLTKRLQIDRRYNGQVSARGTGLWLEDDGLKVAPRWVRRGPRVGVDYAGPVWSKKPWRFQLVPGALLNAGVDL